MNMEQGFRDTFSRDPAMIDEFVSTFALEEQDDNSLYLLHDAIGLGINIITPPLFNNCKLQHRVKWTSSCCPM